MTASKFSFWYDYIHLSKKTGDMYLFAMDVKFSRTLLSLSNVTMAIRKPDLYAGHIIIINADIEFY